MADDNVDPAVDPTVEFVPSEISSGFYDNTPVDPATDPEVPQPVDNQPSASEITTEPAPVDTKTDPETASPAEDEYTTDSLGNVYKNGSFYRAANSDSEVDPKVDPETGQTTDTYTTDSKGNIFKNGSFYRAANSDSEVDTTVDPATGKPTDTYTTDSLGNVFKNGAFYRAAEVAENFTESQLQSLVNNARSQQTYSDQQRQVNSQDWRVRLSLAPQSNYLYNVQPVGSAGILEPLRGTNGVIFPYTPAISTAYRANYTPYDLTHSNYRGYWYQNSFVDNVNITATFTAQNTQEANYMLAVIHFFRSATKMFYGQDAERGSPPPVVYLSGLGEYQFNKHSCLISNFNYSLPADVDYIRAGSTNNLQINQDLQRPKTGVSLNSNFGSLQRLATAILGNGQKPSVGAIANVFSPRSLQNNNPTYVPTKIEIQLTLMPVQSRQQVSSQFSVKNFANGNLLRGGFW